MNQKNTGLTIKHTMEDNDSGKKVFDEKKMASDLLFDLYQKYIDYNPELEEMLKQLDIDSNHYIQFLSSLLKNVPKGN